MNRSLNIVRQIFLFGQKYSFDIFSLAPDYILCSKATENRLVPEIIKAWQNFYTDNPLNSESYCRIVNNRHFQRVQKLINNDKVVHGGQTDSNENYIAPTIMYKNK